MHATVHRRDGTQSTRAGSALESALALALALDGIPGVKVAATAFPGIAGTPDRATRMVRHGESPRACAGAFVQAPRGGTPMAQALWYAAADLLACREERRMLVVLTDKEPDDAAEVLRLLGLCRQAGIETVGIGIGICVLVSFDLSRIPFMGRRAYALHHVAALQAMAEIRDLGRAVRPFKTSAPVT